NLVKLAHRKLRPHGILILETPNPQCLTVFAESFYMDLSHIRLVHPEAARFLLESTGFQNVELKFSQPVQHSKRIPPLAVSGMPEVALREFNRGIDRLNELLYGFQDYGVIGKKGAASTEFAGDMAIQLPDRISLSPRFGLPDWEHEPPLQQLLAREAKREGPKEIRVGQVRFSFGTRPGTPGTDFHPPGA